MYVSVSKFNLEYILAIKMEIGMLKGQKSLKKREKKLKTVTVEKTETCKKRRKFAVSNKIRGILEGPIIYIRFLKSVLFWNQVGHTKNWHYFHWIQG